jgi:hypothetical protein
MKETKKDITWSRKSLLLPVVAGLQQTSTPLVSSCKPANAKWKRFRKNSVIIRLVQCTCDTVNSNSVSVVAAMYVWWKKNIIKAIPQSRCINSPSLFLGSALRSEAPLRQKEGRGRQ